MSRRPRRRKIKFDSEYAVISCVPDHKGPGYICKVLGLDSLRLFEAYGKRDRDPGTIVEKKDLYVYPERRVMLDDAEREILLNILRDYVKKNERFYLMIVNYGEMYTKTIHILELLPGIGRATRKKIESMRPFQSLDEVKEKLKIDIVDAIAKRIMKEILGETDEKVYARRPRTGSQG